MATINLPIKVQLEFDVDLLRATVDQHAEALQQHGRIEVVRYVLSWLGEDALDAAKLKHGLALEFGSTFMQEVLMDQLVDEGSEKDRYCPRCGSEDPRLRFAGCQVFDDDTAPPHTWHTEQDPVVGPLECSQCGSHVTGTRSQIDTPGHPLYGRACENVHFHGPEEEW